MTFSVKYDIITNCKGEMSMKYCYIRVSQSSQEYDRQIHIFKDRGYLDGVNCTYVEEKFTGTTLNRPAFKELLEKLVEGDTLVVESLSRLSRGGVIKTLELISHLVQDKKVNITIFKEGFELVAGEKPNSTTSLLLGIFSVLGQFERDLISERTKEGLKAVKEEGKPLGRPLSARSGLENFIKTLEYMIENHVGQRKAAYLMDFPERTLQYKIQECYEHYNTKDYREILNKLKEDEPWGLF